VRYGQTPDGVKHIYTLPEEPASSAAAAGNDAGNDASDAQKNASSDETSANNGPAIIASGAARGVMQPVEDIPATPPSPAPRAANKTAANKTAYLPLPK
jgi:type III secretion protein D